MTSQGAQGVSIEEILALGIAHGASDLHFKAGMAPVFRIDGHLKCLPGLPVLDAETLNNTLLALLDDRQKQLLKQHLELDASLVFADQARVRVNMYLDINSIACAMRIVPFEVPTLKDLDMPPIVEKLTQIRSGLILVTGVTGAGKSTLLAAMIETINRRQAAHIYTIEDPIEFVHRPIRSVITQREVGSNTQSFAGAVRSSLRADPNVLLIGEMRDPETILASLKAAETGLLVLSTLHTRSAAKTIQRIVSIFEPKEQEAVRVELAHCLAAVICQQLIPLCDGGRMAAHEIMINTPAIKEAILYGELNKISEYIQSGSYDGMQLMDIAIQNAHSQGLIDGTTAVEFSLNPQEMERSLRGAIINS